LRKLKLFLIMLLVAAVLLPQTAYAVSQTDSAEPELTIYCQADQENLVGVNFEIYQIAKLTGNGGFRITGRFSDFESAVQNISDPWLLAGELQYHVLESGLKPNGECTTGQDGIARFPQSGETLERGLYLVLGRRHVQSGYVYVMNPMLVSFPRYDEATKEFSNHCQIKPKYERFPVPEDGKIDRKVLQIWQDNGNKSYRPVQIKVMLLKDREVYDTVVLSKDNGWSYTWKDLSFDAEWTILEERVEYYRPSVTQEGITFKLTNELIPPPGPPTETTEPPTEPTKPPEEPPKLPQTGQLWWPVPVLFLMGIMFVVVGTVRRREAYYED
jgi:hypothetical protein